VSVYCLSLCQHFNFNQNQATCKLYQVYLSLSFCK